MSSIDAFDRLKESSRNYREYPMNLVNTKMFYTELMQYRRKLAERTDDGLFSATSRPMDFIESWDGDQDPQEIKVTDLARHTSSNRKDPKSRSIFIDIEDSQSPLNCTGDQLRQLLTYHQVTPSFLDSLLTVGPRTAPGSLYGQDDMLLEAETQRLEVKSLGRSGLTLQHFFTLQTADSPKTNDERSWSIRQASVYHSFDIVTGRSVFIAAADETLSDRLRGMLLFSTSFFTGGPNSGPTPTSIATSFGATLSTHLEYFRWCEETWRDYLQHVACVLEIEKNMLLKRVENFIDQLDESILAMDQNELAMGSIVRHYSDLVSMPEVLNAINGERCADIARFFEQTSTIKTNLRSHQLRLETLKRKTELRRDMKQATLSFQKIATKMARASERTRQETTRMKIITLVTLTFLPGTFVAILMRPSFLDSSPGSPCPLQTEPPASWPTPASQDMFDNGRFILLLPAGITAFVIGVLYVLRRMGNLSKVFSRFTSRKGGNLMDGIAEGHHQRDELEKDQFELPLSTSRYMD